MADLLQVTLKPICLSNKFPKVKLLLKDSPNLIELTSIQTIDVPIYNGDNQFQIEFLNKESKDTKVVDGKIVEDLAVIIDRMDYKGFDFLPYIDQLGIYVTKDNKHITGTNGFMAFTGTFKFNILGPLFILSRDLAIING